MGALAPALAEPGKGACEDEELGHEQAGAVERLQRGLEGDGELDELAAPALGLQGDGGLALERPVDGVEHQVQVVEGAQVTVTREVGVTEGRNARAAPAPFELGHGHKGVVVVVGVGGRLGEGAWRELAGLGVRPGVAAGVDDGAEPICLLGESCVALACRVR